jgi:hypothetical protein
MFIICLLVSLYVFFAVLLYGFSFAYWQRKWPSQAEVFYEGDRNLSLLTAVFWPLGFLSAFCSSDGTLFNYGVKFK